MANLCQTCAVEHAMDNTGTQCTAVQKAQQVAECPKYRATREKRLEDALRCLCEALDGVTHDGGIRIHLALGNACELIQRKP